MKIINLTIVALLLFVGSALAQYRTFYVINSDEPNDITVYKQYYNRIYKSSGQGFPQPRQSCEPRYSLTKKLLAELWE